MDKILLDLHVCGEIVQASFRNNICTVMTDINDRTVNRKLGPLAWTSLQNEENLRGTHMEGGDKKGKMLESKSQSAYY